MLVNITKKKAVEVASYAEASQVVRAHWDNKSGRAFYQDPKAGIIEIDGKPVAHVSYNGRVWEGVNRMAVGKEIVTGS